MTNININEVFLKWSTVLKCNILIQHSCCLFQTISLSLKPFLDIPSMTIIMLRSTRDMLQLKYILHHMFFIRTFHHLTLTILWKMCNFKIYLQLNFMFIYIWKIIFYLYTTIFCCDNLTSYLHLSEAAYSFYLYTTIFMR